MTVASAHKVWEVLYEKVHIANLAEMAAENKVGLSLAMVTLGLACCLVGRSMVRVVLFSAGATVAGGTAYATTLHGLELEHTKLVHLYSASLWLMAAGLAGGAACAGLVRAGLVVLGGLAGAEVGVLLGKADAVESADALVLISVSLVFGLSLLAYLALPLLVVLITATLGGLLVTLGADVLLETGFSDFILALDDATHAVWAMAVATAVIALTGTLVQLGVFPNPLSDPKEETE